MGGAIGGCHPWWLTGQRWERVRSTSIMPDLEAGSALSTERQLTDDFFAIFPGYLISGGLGWLLSHFNQMFSILLASSINLQNNHSNFLFVLLDDSRKSLQIRVVLRQLLSYGVAAPTFDPSQVFFTWKTIDFQWIHSRHCRLIAINLKCFNFTWKTQPKRMVYNTSSALTQLCCQQPVSVWTGERFPPPCMDCGVGGGFPELQPKHLKNFVLFIITFPTLSEKNDWPPLSPDLAKAPAFLLVGAASTISALLFLSRAMSSWHEAKVVRIRLVVRLL